MLISSKIHNADLMSPDQAMFCTPLSHFGMVYNCYQERDFYRACDGDMLNSLVILTILKIISINGSIILCWCAPLRNLFLARQTSMTFLCPIRQANLADLFMQLMTMTYAVVVL